MSQTVTGLSTLRHSEINMAQITLYYTQHFCFFPLLYNVSVKIDQDSQMWIYSSTMHDI